MKVRFRTNLGSRDAVKFGLDHDKCSIDSEHEFNEELALRLASFGLVEIDEASKKSGRPVSDKIEAVPDAPTIADSEPVEIAGSELEESDFGDFKESSPQPSKKKAVKAAKPKE